MVGLLDSAPILDENGVLVGRFPSMVQYRNYSTTCSTHITNSSIASRGTSFNINRISWRKKDG